MLLPICVGFMIIASAAALPAPTERVSAWRADVDSLVARILRVHPRPWAHTTREVFMRRAAALRTGAAQATDGEMLAGMMRLAATLEDGHTFISDLGPAGARWFPARFYSLSDGLWITAIDSAHAGFAGARVARLGNARADSAVAAMLELISGDNPPGRREGAAYLSNAVLLQALGLNHGDALTLQTSKGAVTLHAVDQASGDIQWSQYGEIGGPAGIRLVTAFGGRTAAAYRDPAPNADLPLHLRGRRAYWWTVLPSDSSVYFAFNNVVAKSAFSSFTLLEELGQALAHVDSLPAATTRFILDVRYNSGGDGTLTPAIVNEFVKRESTIGRRGRLFVITGRKTFSAAAGTVIDLLHHTSAILVGEPMGVAFNSSGDEGYSTLPNHKIGMAISTNTNFTARLEGLRMIPVQVPAQMDGASYFAGRDPALEAILSAPAPYPDVLTALRERGGASARALWADLDRRYGAIEWWEPFTWSRLNSLSYDLLDAQRVDDAIAGFELNTQRFPSRWEPWDSLGEAYLRAGRREAALAAYERALRLAPDNWNAENQRKVIAELHGASTH